jgi:NodT family efflux transporter outer membrane factor (OMF) lipoprotein
MTKYPLTAFASLLLVSACTLAPDYEQPRMEAGLDWKQEAGSAENTIVTEWWKDFSSAQLNELVTKALAKNNDLAASLQRVEQARASVKKSGSSLWPEINASGNASKNWREVNNVVASTEGRSAGLSVSYELDLFGKNRSALESSEAQLEASQFDHEALRIVTAADTVKAYADALASSERIAVSQSYLNIANDLLRIIQARVKEGAASELELAQQKSTVASAEASKASLVLLHEGYISQLAVLTGEAPQTFKLSEEAFSKLIAPAVKPVIPSRLAGQRPDIRAAEANLIAANADIGAARAAYFPSLNLGVDGVLSGVPAFSLLTLSASALAPIFNAGSIDSDVERSQARKEELVAAYRQTILSSFKEVNDGLAAVKAAEARTKALTTAMEQSRKAYSLARKRYDSGSIDFQALLDTQRSLLQSEDSATQARLEKIEASIDLIRALGGGFTVRSP